MPKKKADGLISRAELSRLLGKSLTTVDHWRRSGCPEEGTKRGPRFDLAAVVEWRLERERESARRDDEVIDLEIYRARKLRADTETAELALEEARGQVIPTDIVISVLDDVLGNVRAGLLGLPGRQAPRVARKNQTEAKAVLRDGVLEILEELSNGSDLARRAGDAARRAPPVVRGARSR